MFHYLNRYTFLFQKFLSRHFKEPKCEASPTMVRKTKAQKREEMNEIFENANYNLTMVSQDHTVPRNIRKVAQESVDAIAKMDMDGKNQDNSPAIAASTVISLLTDVTQDLNLPFHTRTKIFQILAMLEQIHDI